MCEPTLSVVAAAEIEKINMMSHVKMASLYRYAPIGHAYFDISLPYFEIFQARFEKLGGMTAAVSKII